MQALRPLQGYRFLVVEDEWLIRLLLTEMIEELGGTVTATAHSLDNAFDTLADLQVDCVTLDVALGDQLSFPFATALEKASIPFVFCTAYSDTPAINKQMANVPYIAKPLRKSDLVKAVLSVVKPRDEAG